MSVDVEKELFENDNDDFPIKCWKCKGEFLETVAQIKSGQSQCPCKDDIETCGARISHSLEQFKAVQMDPQARAAYLRQFIRRNVDRYR
jgi:hypothetical protein